MRIQTRLRQLGFCGNVTSLESVLLESWQAIDEETDSSANSRSWRDIANERGWTVLIM